MFYNKKSGYTKQKKESQLFSNVKFENKRPVNQLRIINYEGDHPVSPDGLPPLKRGSDLSKWRFLHSKSKDNKKFSRIQK